MKGILKIGLFIGVAVILGIASLSLSNGQGNNSSSENSSFVADSAVGSTIVTEQKKRKQRFKFIK